MNTNYTKKKKKKKKKKKNLYKLYRNLWGR